MGRSADQRRDAVARGHEAEARVAAFLIAEGWRVLARNWRARVGELDLVAERDGQLRFVEVKQRAAGDVVGLEVVTAEKRRRLIRTAQSYLDRVHPTFDEVAFMVAWVKTNGDLWHIEIIDDAFDVE